MTRISLSEAALVVCSHEEKRMRRAVLLLSLSRRSSVRNWQPAAPIFVVALTTATFTSQAQGPSHDSPWKPPHGGKPPVVTPLDSSGVKHKWLDVAYANGSPAQKLDIYLPNEGSGPFPVILAIHGGGFAMGDKNSTEVAPEFAGVQRGYAVVSANYRLSGEAVFPAAIYDLKAAVRFIRANAAKYNLNPNRIAAWGDSAGANMASMLGTSAGVKQLEDLSMGNPTEPSNVEAVVDLFGPTNFATMDEDFIKAGFKGYMIHSDADSSESEYMGFQVTKYPEKTRLADPETYISAKTPPFFIENGTMDNVVPMSQDARLAAALEKAIGKDKVVHVVLEGAGHGGPQFGTPENLDKVYAFLDKYLK